MDNRKELFRALVGSHNYNMATETSDRDYKAFVTPTFEDLYFNKSFSKSIIGEKEDLDIHDIRKLSNLLWKSNVNFMEVLFSEEVKISEDISDKTRENIEWIFENRQALAKMNLPYLYNACIGMHLNKVKLIDKYTEGTKELYEKYGYDTKSATHSIRILMFLERFCAYNFDDFKKSIWTTGKDKEKLLNIKNGKMTRDEFVKYAKETKEYIEGKYRVIYGSCKPNEELQEELIGKIIEIVREEM